MSSLLAFLALLWAQTFGVDKKPAPKAEIVEVNRIWSRAPHNAFTDLVRFRGRWYCAFREGTKHDSYDGKIRILSSPAGDRWDSAALITDDRGDLRDPKLSITPDHRLLLIAGLAYHPPSAVRHQTVAWQALDGRDWGPPESIADRDVWLWRVSWHRGKAYGFGYGTSDRKFLRGYIGHDGIGFQTHTENAFDRDYPNETAILFRGDDTAVCLLRRDAGSMTAQLGASRPPYRAWSWTDLGVRIGGPNMMSLPDGRIVAAVRLYDPKPRMALCWLDTEQPALNEFLSLPSGGDTSYAGLAWHDDLLWVSYYSTHEERTSIYLAKVKVPKKP